jgi:hypothetical protein
MKCTPCRVSLEGTRYAISVDGTVRPTRVITEEKTNAHARGTGEFFKTRVYDAPVDRALAQRVRREASRQRRNRNARERHDACRSLGLTKTPFGWE